MFSLTIITGLVSLMGCFCMAFVCAAQLAELFTALRPAEAQPWEIRARAQPAQPARYSWNTSAYVQNLARLDAQLAPSTL